MRLPLAVNLESRQGSDDPVDSSYLNRPRNVARVVNGIVEVKGDRAFVRKRPGLVSLGQIRAGVGQLLWNWNGIRAVVDDYINSGTISTIVGSPTATSLTPSNADLQFSAANTGSGAATPRMMFKNRTQAWTMNRSGTVSAVTYGGSMGSETFAVVSLTRSGTTATGTVASDLPFRIGENVTIVGAVETAYNGTFALTGVTAGVYRAERVIPITITRSGTTATATSTEPHGLSTGTYTIAGANDAAYNGSKSITVVTDYTFTYTVTVTPAATTTWNPSDKSANITLSSGNLKATESLGDGGFYAARGTVGKASGKWYWEVTVNALGGGVQLGAETSSHTLANFVGSAANGWGYTSTGSSWDEGTPLAGWAATYTAADVIGVALDMDSGEISFYKNGVLQGKLTGVSGTVYPAVSAAQSGAATANFGGSAFTHTIPTGFSALASDTPASPAAGSITVTDPAVATPATFTYTVAGSPSTPATGTITVQGSGGTVPGIVYINGYFVVMDTSGRIWNSASEDPTTWGALDYIDAQNDSSRGVGIAFSRGYVVAFKEWSTEFFYDAANATGSPLSPVDNGTIQTGCATGWSIASIDDSTFWMSQTKAKGRGVHVLSGLETRKVSTPDVDRILDDDALSNVYAYCLKVEGHTLYVLTLAPVVTAGNVNGITLVYDLTSDTWVEWAAPIFGAGSGAVTGALTSITRSGNVATVTHDINDGFSDGMAVTVSGAGQNEYNGLKQVRRIDSTHFEFDVTGDPLTPATGTLAYAYIVPRRLPFVSAISFGDDILLLHESTGSLWALDDAKFTDNGYGIEFIVRTPRFDGGTLDRKSCASVSLIGTKVSDYAAIRWSDDDFDTMTKFRMVDLSRDQPILRRCGAFKRRAFEIVHVGNTEPIFEALEIDFGK